ARLLNCVVRGNRVLHYGGGVYLEYGGLVSNCSIIGNVAVYAGGGVFCQQGGVVADCVISGNRTDARFGDGGGVVLYGAGRVERSRVEQNKAGLSGGGIWLSDSAEVLNTVVAHNRARRAGGGIYANRGGVVQASRVVQNRVRGQGGGVSAGSGTRLIACELVGNRAGDGGGVRAYDAVFSACLVASNVAERGGGVFSNSGSVSNILLVANVARVGGGLWCEHAAQPQELVIMGNRARVGGGAYVSRQGVVSKSVIVHNSARAGGGVGCQNGGHVEECIIRSNIARRGGGVWTPPGSASEAAPLITRCLIEYNAAHQAAGAWLDGRAVLRNTLLQRNRARRQAGGAYVTGQSVVENCLLTRNRADREIGGLTGTNGTVVNTIVFANLAPLAPEYDPTAQALAFSFSCTTPLPPGPGNLATDPGLLMTGAFPRPGPTSPCINAGRNAAWMAGACDFEGHPRLVGPRVDIGCHEFSAYANDRAPALLVTSPPPWSAFAFANSNVVVHGIVYDDYGTFPVTRDGRPVRMFQPPAWSDQVGLNVGTNWLVYTVRDAAGYTATATVAYILKPEYDGPVVENTTVYVARNGAHHAPFTSWATAATNLADAALAAGPGCTIVVSSGHYRLGQTVELRRPVRVRGLGHVVLDGVGARRCLTLLATGIVLEQLVISNGVAGFGAGVYARYAATLRECTITANRATVHGGGVFCERTLLLERTRLTANRAGQRGGAIFGGNDITLQQCLIDHNLALDDAGGVWGAYAPRLYRCLLWANCASNDGGGLVSVTLGDVRECVFEQNIAGQRGGGARVGDETRVLNCIFRSNQAHEGGALVAEYSRIRNVLCHDNRASAGGGGVVCGPGGTLDNGTIVFNHARYAGGVVATHGTQVRNAILYYNTPGNFTRRGRTVRVTASCVTPRTAGTGILTSPPRFLDSGANDFRLAPDSACIDAAIMLPWMARSRDLYGTPRVIGAAPDIGACEFTPEPASNQPFFALWDAFLPTDVPEPAGFALGVFFLGLCGLFLRRK
ncbi:MAG: hypothetical protein N2595_11195, partial [bacterium]|nr:hypothetical protein [bacterium]